MTSSRAGLAEPDLDALSERIGYTFNDPGLLRRAMAHRSWCAEVAGDEGSNERLEFLGDAVLGWIVADLAFRQFADLPEGKLTDLRKSVVNASALADTAAELDIGTYLMLGRGEDAAGGRSKPSILSDAFEAVLGAIYIDSGTEAAYAFVERVIGDRLLQAVLQLDRLDYKTMLQELAVRRFDAAPVYILSEDGPDHAKQFSASAIVAGQIYGQGQGRSKKIAEQAAAAEACHALGRAAADDVPG
ncbi:MAG: rnc [Ilumatobacteraceae bacterium]|nr:rnc [Ilumatobacteraceae bacterium]